MIREECQAGYSPDPDDLEDPELLEEKEGVSEQDIALETVEKARAGWLGTWRPLDEFVPPEVFVGVDAGELGGRRIIGNATQAMRARMISDGEAILDIDERGFVETRVLSDGRFAAVVVQLFGAGLLSISETEDDDGWEDGYHYADLMGAINALQRWSPEEEAEPSRSVRLLPSCRRRRYDKEGGLLEEYA